MATIEHFVSKRESGLGVIADARYDSKTFGNEHVIHYEDVHGEDEPCPGLLIGARFTRRCFAIGESCEHPYPNDRGLDPSLYKPLE